MGVGDEALQSMLLAWYYSGYATGRYQALREMGFIAAEVEGGGGGEGGGVGGDTKGGGFGTGGVNNCMGGATGTAEASAADGEEGTRADS